MINVFWKPQETIKKMKNYNYWLTFLYLVITGLLLFFTAKILGLTWMKSLYVLLGVIVTLILAALSLNIVLWVWNKNNYMQALNVLVMPWFILAIGAFLMSIFNLIPTVGPLLTGLTTLLIMPFGISILLRLFMETFKMDLLTTIVILLIINVGASAAIMGIISALALQLVSTLGFGLLPLGFP